MQDKNKKSERDGKAKGIVITIALPEKVNARVDNGIVIVNGPTGEVKKNLLDKTVGIECKDNSLILKTPRANKINKKHIKSYAAHIRNMIKGSLEAYVYKLKICSGHFPMNVSVSNGQFIVKNLLGEKVPRVLKLKDGAIVKVEGDIVTVESPSKETAGQVSADIENLTKRNGYDLRIFQDGIWITTKGGKEAA